MKKTLWFAIPSLVCWIGCGAEGNGTLDPQAEGADITRATAAFSSCTVLGRSNLPNGGFVETLRCDGVACTRTCLASSIGGATVCSMKCENGPTVPSTPPTLDLSGLRPECQIQPVGRVNAGWPGISKTTCEGERASCFDNRTSDPKFPWCYEPLGKQPSCGGIAPAQRVNAGFPGISGEDCVRNRGACFDHTIPNVPWCFQFPTP
jgi:hypothetical protein